MVDQVDEVKTKTDIVSLIGEYLELKKAGRNYKALCPFHSEKTPSFTISPELQIYKCFGCSESGDALSFLQKHEGMEFGEALRFLADRAGVKLSVVSRNETSDKERLYEINSLASKFYHYLLLNHRIGQIALQYLTQERGLTVDTIKTFQLGFSPDDPTALRQYLVGKKRIGMRDLEKMGLVYIRNGGIFDRFAGRIIFPLFDHRGNVVGFAGRILENKAGSGLSKYINTPETSIYHKSKILYGLNLAKNEIKLTRRAVIVEGELDTISCWQAGIKNVVAIKGSALTEDQVVLLKRFAETLVLALDTDIAGDMAVRRGISIAENQDLEVRVARLEGFKDPDEVVRKNPAGLKKIVDSSTNVWDFLVDSIFSRYDTDKGEGKAKISREVIPVLEGISDSIVQAHYIGLVAKRLGVPIDAVAREVVNAKSMIGDRLKEVETLFKPKTKGRRDILEERLVTIAFRFKPKILATKEVFLLISNPLFRRIVEEYLIFLKKQERFDPKRGFDLSVFAAGLPKELFNGFADLIFKDLKGLGPGPSLSKQEEALYQDEIEGVKRELRLLNIREELKELETKISVSESEGEKGQIVKLKEKFKSLTRKLAQLRS